MKIYSKSNKYGLSEKSVVTIGTFDGLHLGHQKLLEVLKAEAKKNNSQTCVITFDPHPRTVISKNFDLGLITSLDEKIEYFEKLNIDTLIILDFNQEFSSTPYEKFIVEYILNKINTEHLIIGYDHKFGKDRDGDEIKLRLLGEKYNFSVTKVNPVENKGETISSTIIRKSISLGEIKKVNSMLGRPFIMKGKIIEGSKRGRVLGFPTANVELNNPLKIIPKNGVYVVKCLVKSNQYDGIMNIGFRPTFENSNERFLEVHLFNFDNEIYGEQIDVYFHDHLREEVRFKSEDKLIEQIENDKKKAIEFFNNNLIN